MWYVPQSLISSILPRNSHFSHLLLANFKKWHLIKLKCLGVVYRQSRHYRAQKSASTVHLYHNYSSVALFEFLWHDVSIIFHPQCMICSMYIVPENFACGLSWPSSSASQLALKKADAVMMNLSLLQLGDESYTSSSSGYSQCFEVEHKRESWVLEMLNLVNCVLGSCS